MYDKNLLFDDAATITASTSSPPAIDVGKTPSTGIDVVIDVTAASGTSPTLDCKVQESTATNSGFTDVVTFDQITGTGSFARVVQSKKRYLRLVKTVGGSSPSFTLTAGIVSGKQRYQAA